MMSRCLRQGLQRFAGIGSAKYNTIIGLNDSWRQLHVVACSKWLTHRYHKSSDAFPKRRASSASGSMCVQDYVFRQLFDPKSWTYSYVLGDPQSRQAVIVDPVYEQVDRDFNVVTELGLNLVCGINTHVHIDHVTGTGTMKRHVPSFQSVIGKNVPARADRYVTDGELIKFGRFQLECISTPGHTNGCMTLIWHEKCMAFTGDALLIRKCGRTNILDGDPVKLYKSVHEKIFMLPDHYTVYPGHDYTGLTSSSIGEEKRFNARFKKPLADFVALMNGLDEFPKSPYNGTDESNDDQEKYRDTNLE